MPEFPRIRFRSASLQMTVIMLVFLDRKRATLLRGMKESMKIDVRDFQVPEGKKVDLDDWPTDVKPLYKSEAKYEERLQTIVGEMSELQQLLYADNRCAILLIFQAMDAAGKDGAIAHVLSGINPQGCQVFSFKAPSAEELDHDFLWRTNRCLPERGRIGIFNRSYYEEVLIVKVHPDMLIKQGIDPDRAKKKSFWNDRYRSIVESERHLHSNGTHVIKFFLHVSKDEQRRRFLDRIDDSKKNWKFNASDVEERKLWDEYMHVYGQCLAETSTDDSPWYVVPANDKKNARLIISQVIFDTMRKIKMSYPTLSEEHVEELKRLRVQLLE